MKKRIVSCMLILGVIWIMTVASTKAEISSFDKIENWGNSVQKYVVNPIGENSAVVESLKPVKDNKIILPEIEINQAKDFYIAAGYEEKGASDLAVKYVKDINTLYQEAIKNGYNVTDDEILAHIEQMKKEFEVAENKDEIDDFIDNFENEDAYWKFQFEMLKKDLPIQKYVSEKERNYISKNMPINEVSEYIGDNTSADEIMKVQEKWDSEFEIMKESIESNYSYIIK